MNENAFEADVSLLARQLVERIHEVYRPEYIEKADREDPGSLLGLSCRLQRALEGERP